MVAGPDPSLLSQPSNAIRKALDREGLAIARVDLFEINEAFASVAIQSMGDLGITHRISLNYRFGRRVCLSSEPALRCSLILLCTLIVDLMLSVFVTVAGLL